ncbi:RNA-binding domain-containing protein [Acidaminobacter hydrogenoformans]|uniref:ATP-dependent DNA helicase RecG n=1 Tax=Acidaminobacter hydrogenoformans DSM 2784 TaxID=1120920 RepID=A0A1G5RQP6_9FIRM|nr:RNA-binding domain-containing protein [Acidaminobacter hydrogenoformans]SCZ76354.1 ATP-dependent DNA helicase RecG [Acidaminobacter hydrogenoformans DSM 2784]
MFTESKTIELKREYTEDIRKSVTAFANTDGGKIYIGIQDNGSVVGISQKDDLMTRVSNMIRDSIRPDVTLFTDISIEQFDRKDVLVIHVQRGTARPYYLHGKGIRPEGVYIRQGASSVPATEAAILNMIKETSGDSFEKARSLNQQLTFDGAAAYFEKMGVEFFDTQKKTLHLIDQDGMFTNLGLLLSDQATHTIKLAVFEGDKKTIFKERREFTGSILLELEEAYDFIERYNKTRSEFKGLERMDQRDYPIEAIREALLNAVVHRDYAYSGSILISLYDNRLEIVTIGGLVKGISLNDIMLGVSVLRNQHLANIFYRLKLIEAYGTGIPKMMAAYDDYEVKPMIEVSDHAFKITLPNTNYKHSAMKERLSSGLSQRELQILTLLKRNKVVGRKEVELEVGISQATAVVTLRNMLKKGLIEKVGSGKNMKYKISQ